MKNLWFFGGYSLGGVGMLSYFTYKAYKNTENR
jgi:hypothetical protein